MLPFLKSSRKMEFVYWKHLFIALNYETGIALEVILLRYFTVHVIQEIQISLL